MALSSIFGGAKHPAPTIMVGDVRIELSDENELEQLQDSASRAYYAQLRDYAVREARAKARRKCHIPYVVRTKRATTDTSYENYDGFSDERTAREFAKLWKQAHPNGEALLQNT